MKVSHSRVKLWRKCAEAHHLRYNEKLRRKRVSRPLAFGRLVHDTVEAYANGLNPLKRLTYLVKRDDKMFRSQREEYGELVYDVTAIMTEYFDYYSKSDLEYVQYNDKGSEHTFEVEIAKDITAIGKIDAYGKAKKLRWLVEHKSGKNIPNEDQRWRQMQDSLYIRIGDMLGLPKVDGTLWDYIRSKSPTKPKVLKDGSISSREIDTLPIVVKDVLGKTTGERRYAALLKQAEANRQNYFQRIYSPVKKDVVDLMFKNFVASARDIADQGEKRRELNVGFHCGSCDYEPICRARLSGLDVDFIKAKDFTVSKGHEHEDPDFEA